MARPCFRFIATALTPLVAACGLSACGFRSAQGHRPINTGLAAAPAPARGNINQTPDWARGTSVDVQAVLDNMDASAAATDTVLPRTFGINEPFQPPAPITDKNGPTTLPAADGSTITVTVNPLKPEPGVDTVGGQPTPERPLTQRIDDAAVSLIDLLAQQCMTGDMPWKNYLALAALDALHPGAVPTVITPDQKAGGPLNADDRQAVESLREFFAGIAAIPSDTSPDARADKMAELADRLLESRPMRIRSAALCSRVGGYGQFTPLPSSRFPQGRPIRAIVYAELTRFGHRPLSESTASPNVGPGDRWTVELSQTLQLFHDADGTLAWSRPEERITETSRNKRKDFFLIHEITLPPTLTIGAYKLKVVMKDKTTGHQDEAIIPLEIVADAQAAAGN